MTTGDVLREVHLASAAIAEAMQRRLPDGRFATVVVQLFNVQVVVGDGRDFVDDGW